MLFKICLIENVCFAWGTVSLYISRTKASTEDSLLSAQLSLKSPSSHRFFAPIQIGLMPETPCRSRIKRGKDI